MNIAELTDPAGMVTVFVFGVVFGFLAVLLFFWIRAKIRGRHSLIGRKKKNVFPSVVSSESSAPGGAVVAAIAVAVSEKQKQ